MRPDRLTLVEGVYAAIDTETGEVHTLEEVVARLPWRANRLAPSEPRMPAHEYAVLVGHTAQEVRDWNVVAFLIDHHAAAYLAYFRLYQLATRYLDFEEHRYWRCHIGARWFVNRAGFDEPVRRVDEGARPIPGSGWGAKYPYYLQGRATANGPGKLEDGYGRTPRPTWILPALRACSSSAVRPSHEPGGEMGFSRAGGNGSRRSHQSVRLDRFEPVVNAVLAVFVVQRQPHLAHLELLRPDVDVRSDRERHWRFDPANTLASGRVLSTGYVKVNAVWVLHGGDPNGCSSSSARPCAMPAADSGCARSLPGHAARVARSRARVNPASGPLPRACLWAHGEAPGAPPGVGLAPGFPPYSRGMGQDLA
jgi:hypothetical protein